jgi:3-methyladenine DNA glycosylase AlkD
MNVEIRAADVLKELKRLGTPARAKSSARFFKTGEGQYGAGDLFLGVTVPAQRKIARRFRDMPLEEIAALLHEKAHEARLSALFILVERYSRAKPPERVRLARFYLKNRGYVNNWDLVDSFAPYILGRSLLDRDRAILYRLARSKSLGTAVSPSSRRSLFSA